MGVYLVARRSRSVHIRFFATSAWFSLYRHINRYILLNQRKLDQKLFEQVISLLEAKGLLLKKGTIVDSTLIAAPSSTKNKDRQRDPDAHQVKKGNECHFGYKAHIGTDQDSGLVHHIEVTAANVSDVSLTPQLVSRSYAEHTWQKDSLSHQSKAFPDS